MSIKNGGPAFPRTAHHSLTYQDLRGRDADPQEGMTLRQYFAAAALQLSGAYAIASILDGNRSTSRALDADDIANGAYKIADAMIRKGEEK